MNYYHSKEETDEAHQSFSSSVFNQRDERIFSVRQYSDDADEAILESVPEISNGPLIQFHLPFRMCCRYVLLGDWVCVLGGHDEFHLKFYRSFDIFDIGTRRLFKGPNMQGRRSSFATATTDSQIFVFGGSVDERTRISCEYYDSKTNNWIHLPNHPKSHMESSAVYVPGRGVVVVGGRSIENGKVRSLKSAYLLTSKKRDGKKTFSWVALPPMYQAQYLSAIAYFNRRVFVAGGRKQEMFEVEYLEWPERNNMSAQWTFSSLVQIFLTRPISLAVVDDRLWLFNGAGQVLKLKIKKSPRGALEVFEPVCNIARPIGQILIRNI